MKQYRITSEHINQPSDNDCALPPDDPIHELKAIQHLAGLNAQNRLAEYKQSNSNQAFTNMTHTAAEKARIMKDNNIRPGTDEWFKLWFSRPYLTNEKPFDK